MKKRHYTHIQELLPEIKAMLPEGKTRREIAECYGYSDKQVEKNCLSVNEEKNASWKPASFHGPKGGHLRGEMRKRTRRGPCNELRAQNRATGSAGRRGQCPPPVWPVRGRL